MSAVATPIASEADVAALELALAQERLLTTVELAELIATEYAELLEQHERRHPRKRVTTSVELADHDPWALAGAFGRPIPHKQVAKKYRDSPALERRLRSLPAQPVIYTDPDGQAWYVPPPPGATLATSWRVRSCVVPKRGTPCGMPFAATRSNKRTCSSACTTRAWRQRQT
jgi:hypothetical protein